MLPMTLDLETISHKYKNINDWVQENARIMANLVYQALEEIEKGKTDTITLIELCINGKCEYEILLDPLEANYSAELNQQYWVDNEDYYRAARVRDIRKKIHKN